MKTIVLATSNKNKLREIAAVFEKHAPGEYRLLSAAECGFTDEIVEDADSFEGNAYKKAAAVAKATGLLSMADDSGLEVDYLDGRPGVHSARYAGEGATADMLIAKLLKELEGIDGDKRTARFITVMCAIDGTSGYRGQESGDEEKGRILYSRGVCEGLILTGPHGEGGFGYDPVFYYPPLKKTFAQLEKDEKNAASHRGKAVLQMIKLLKELRIPILTNLPYKC